MRAIDDGRGCRDIDRHRAERDPRVPPATRRATDHHASGLGWPGPARPVRPRSPRPRRRSRGSAADIKTVDKDESALNAALEATWSGSLPVARGASGASGRPGGTAGRARRPPVGAAATSSTAASANDTSAAASAAPARTSRRARRQRVEEQARDRESAGRRPGLDRRGTGQPRRRAGSARRRQPGEHDLGHGRLGLDRRQEDRCRLASGAASPAIVVIGSGTSYQAVANVPVTRIGAVSVGQHAVVTPDSTNPRVDGTVTAIGVLGTTRVDDHDLSGHRLARLVRARSALRGRGRGLDRHPDLTGRRRSPFRRPRSERSALVTW